MKTILILLVSMCRRSYVPHADGFEVACSAGRGYLDKVWGDKNEGSHPSEHTSAAAMLWANAHGAELMDEQNSELDRYAEFSRPKFCQKRMFPSHADAQCLPDRSLGMPVAHANCSSSCRKRLLGQCPSTKLMIEQSSHLFRYHTVRNLQVEGEVYLLKGLKAKLLASHS